jgi:2-C-methyl-D-erythritol 2,4-cyclodiphosphate synthase
MDLMPPAVPDALALLGRLRMGQGYDLHRLVPGKPLVLGGVAVPNSPLGCLAHSDGDVVLHALMDAMIGASGVSGDIGTFFPPSDPQWAGANSQTLLKLLQPQLPAIHWLQVDITIFLESPKLYPIKPLIQANLNQLIAPMGAISVKAKTAEGLGVIGQSQAVAASVLVLGIIKA